MGQVKVGALVLAGGKSRRMQGLHKGHLPWENQTIMDHVVGELKKITHKVWISYGDTVQDKEPGCDIVMDIYKDCGPIGGLHAGLKKSDVEWMLVCGCDMPCLKVDLYRYLWAAFKKSLQITEWQAIVPRSEDGIHPLAAIYHHSIAPVLECQIQGGNYRLTHLLGKLKVLYVDVLHHSTYQKMLSNINTLEAYEKLKKEVNHMESLSLEKAREILLERTKKITQTEMVNLWEARNRVLAENMVAAHNQPPFPKSPLDGYALRSAEVVHATPKHPIRLKVIDEIMAGYTSAHEIHEGEAIRIMTGAPIPKGADCVIRQEDTDYGEEEVEIYKSVGHFQNYCFEGEDYEKGTLLLEKGTVLGAIEIGVLASMGADQVLVYRLPAVALLTTGDETVHPGEPLAPGKIYNSNLYTLGSELQSWGVRSVYRDSVSDQAGVVVQWIKLAAEQADLIVTTGGVSVGKKDIMHEVLEELKCEKLFWRIDVKPGMPTLCAVYRGKLLICLSGSPFGATANLALLVRPVLAVMMGRKDLELKRRKAMMANEFSKASSVLRYVRASYDPVSTKVTIPKGSNASGIISSMCGCNCLIEVLPGSKGLAPGESVEVVLL